MVLTCAGHIWLLQYCQLEEVGNNCGESLRFICAAKPLFCSLFGLQKQIRVLEDCCLLLPMLESQIRA